MTHISHGEMSLAGKRSLPCIWLDNTQVKLAITTDCGPRAIWWGLSNGDNILAELPDANVETPFGPYHFLGGHRFWHAPEALNRTYHDPQPLNVATTANSVTITPPPDASGIVRALCFEMQADAPIVTVTHTLTNAGLWPATLAPWALSMCKLGGTVLLPQATAKADADGLLPNQRYSFWPYTNLTDGRIDLGREMSRVHCKPGPPNKLGYRNVHGWIAYQLGQVQFTKRFDPRLDADHPDFGCNTECYCCETFVELETLGPLSSLAPGASVSHVETWELVKFAAKTSDI